MKINNFIKLAVAVLSFFVITNVSALTEEESSYIDNALNYYNSDYSYCSYFRRKAGERDMNDIYCFRNKPVVSCVSVSGYRCNFSNYGNDYLNINFVTSYNGVSPTYTSSIKSDSANFQYVNFSAYSLSHIYSNCSLVDSNNNVIFDNFSFGFKEPIYYTITFNPPSNSTIVVKNSNNEEIQPISQYVYKLEAGNYTYSVSNSLYNNLDNISFVVSKDENIEITMSERLNSQPIRSIYSQYYTYISELISDTFGLENPLFLFIIAFIIGFSLIYLIKKLIGGFL